MSDHFRKEVLVSFVVIVAAFVVFGTASYFLSRDMEFQSSQVVSDRALIAERAAAIGALADLKNNASQADVYRQAMDKILVTQDQLIDFPRWLEGLARGRNITFTFSFSGDQVAPAAGYPGYIAFSIGAQGSLNNLLDFLQDAESRSPKFLVDMENVDLSGSGANYSVSTGGRVFFK